MKTAISIPDEIFAVAELVARRTGMSRSELYTRAVKAFLKSYKNEGVTEALDEIYGDDTSSELDPILARIQAVSLPRDEW